VYALEDLSEGRGVPYHIKIANEHPNPSVRKSAIYALGDSEDSRALEALVEIIRKKN
jgi:HEAT repeat protein